MSKGRKLIGLCAPEHRACRFTAIDSPTSLRLITNGNSFSPDHEKVNRFFPEASPDETSTSNINSNNRVAKLRRGASRDALGDLKEFDDFELLELLGNGFFGQVYKVREKYGDDECKSDSCEPLVMKIPIKHHQHLCHHSAKQIAIKEDSMLRLLHHPNIIRSRGICVQRSSTSWQLNLLIDYCDGGSLQQLIVNPSKPLSWEQRLQIACDVSNALCYVHGEGYMHRDLTPMNILLQSQPDSLYKSIVADFGLSTRIPQSNVLLEQVGSQNWMAPEVLKEEFYNEKADVYSFGIILCQMISRIDADHDAGLFRTTYFGVDRERFKNMCPCDTPELLLRTAFECCEMNYKSRPSFDSLYKQFILMHSDKNAEFGQNGDDNNNGVLL